MSLSATLLTASSGLQAAQASLRAVSDNISNVNTPGYVRKAVNQSQQVVDGVGMGVRIDGIKRITDQYLQMASLTAGSDTERWAAVSQYMDNAQSLFGDPSGDNYFFARLDKVLSSFATAANDPSSSLLRSQALASVQDFLSDAERINTQIVSLTDTVETRTTAGVDRANSLLEEISKLNVDIRRSRLTGGDSSGSENIQSQMVDELAGLMNVRIAGSPNGGVEVRSAEGVLLAGEAAAKLTYNATDNTPGYITARPLGSSTDQPIKITSGQLRGLMDLRDVDLPKLYNQLGEFMRGATDELNAAYNDATAYPAPNSLTGRNTGLDIASALSGFTGTSTVALVSPTGQLQKSIAIDFTAGTMAIDGGAPASFTPGTFLSALGTAIGGSATMTNGVLSLTAAAGSGIAMDAGTSQNAGRGFSQFFGLNDVVRASSFTNYATGLNATDAHGFTPGTNIVLRLSTADGRPIRDVTVAAPGPATATMQDLLNSLNSSSTGVGLYGAFSLDADGVMTFAGSAPENAQVSIVKDNTARGTGGPSISELFGLGVRERAARTGRFKVDPALIADPTKMAMGKLDTTAAVGAVAVRAGDGRGALGVSVAGDRPTLFQAAGALGQVSMTASRYAAEFSGAIGRGAEAADARKESSAAVAREATNRRQSVEGVNLDEEMVNMTTYQQAFNASARMIQAASDMFDTLLKLV